MRPLCSRRGRRFTVTCSFCVILTTEYVRMFDGWFSLLPPHVLSVSVVSSSLASSANHRRTSLSPLLSNGWKMSLYFDGLILWSSSTDDDDEHEITTTYSWLQHFWPIRSFLRFCEKNIQNLQAKRKRTLHQNPCTSMCHSALVAFVCFSLYNLRNHPR